MRGSLVTNADAAAVELASRHRHGSLDAVAKLASAGGRGGLCWMLAVTIAAARRRGVRAAPAAAAVVGAFLASVAAARLVRRPRPFVTTGATPVIPPPQGPSCPSDHAASSVAGAYVLSRLAPGWRAEAWTVAALICASRVYAGVHYPSDLLAGAAVGAAAGRLWTRFA